jgi:hypothetical protein
MYDFGFRKSPSGYAQKIRIVNLAFDTLKFSMLSNQTWRCIERYIRIKIRPKPSDEILSKIGRTSRIGTYGSNNPLPEELIREHYDQSMLMDCSVFYTVPNFYVLIYSIDSLRKYFLGHTDIVT